MSDYITALTTVDSVNHKLVFDTEGYYVVGDDQWQDITFATTLTYSGGNIGIAPRIYASNLFLYMTLRNEATDELGTDKMGLASFDAQMGYDTFNLGQVTLPPLTEGQSYTLSAEMKGTNYRISLDGTVIFNIEYPGLIRGQVGVYATAGNSCTSIQVDSLYAEAWEDNAASVPGAIVGVRELDDENKYLYLSNPIAGTLYARQRRTVLGGRQHALSFDYQGAGQARITEKNGAAPQGFTFVLPEKAEWGRESFVELLSADCTSVDIMFVANAQTLMVNAVQFEEKDYATGYIHNDSVTDTKVRERSIITYPARDNLRPDVGSLAMWFNPSIAYDASTNLNPVLFEYGTNSPLRLHYEGGALVFEYGTASVSLPADLLAGVWQYAVATWSRGRIQLYFGDVVAEQTGYFGGPDSGKLIHIGHSASGAGTLFYGAIDETIVLSSVLTKQEVATAASSIEPIATNNTMVMRATFNYAIGNFNKSIIEATLVPDYGSPVLVEKADGTAMRKVSFFDFYTGEYRTFNEEVVLYDRRNDYVTISYHDNDVDQTSFKLKIEDAAGVQFGMPYEMDGFKVRMELTEAEKKTLDGQYLYVSYQLEDSYTVDFNIGVPDSFRVTLGKHDGQGVKVTYEGNGFTDKKLLTMVELNPLLSPNHQGFLYVTRNDEPVTAFRIQATPGDLPANGGSEALVVVEPLDANGNYVSHCRLDVTADLGTIVAAYDEDSVKLRDRAGRFLYRYRSPILSIETAGAMEVQDAVNAIDRETGVGVQIPITLTCLLERVHEKEAGETLEKVAERHGSTAEDIAYTEDMMDRVRVKYGTDLSGDGVTSDRVIAAARRFVLEAAVGTPIQVPINYSSKQLEQNSTAIEHDKMIAYLMDVLTDHLNQPAVNLPAGLGALLDFNGDGMVDTLEMVWLQNNRLTTALQDKYKEVLAWDNAN